MAIAHLHGPARDVFQRAGLLATIGAGHIFGNVADAVHWATRRQQKESSTEPNATEDQ